MGYSVGSGIRLCRILCGSLFLRRLILSFSVPYGATGRCKVLTLKGRVDQYRICN